MSHDELFVAMVTLMVTSITAPMLVAWWNTRLREQTKAVERARRDGQAGNPEIDAKLDDIHRLLTEALQRCEREGLIDG